ncbi:MAG: ribosome biogenesis GTP-binding protein YihA/YsxC [Proteobacteria bacterium]|nr:ribosome biogenesis GTP-binding protein YihA/YsxC [Pseudomonadota bacterium]
MSAFSNAVFLTSVAKLDRLPPDGPPEVAFIGRSNVGKSSTLNSLARRRKLAFVSKTPGRTQMINFFSLGTAARLADLPGYGYAKVPEAVKAEWDTLAGGYLATRASLVVVVVIMDARRPFTPHDAAMIAWLRPIGVRVLLLLSKADKLGRRDRDAALAEAVKKLAMRGVEGEVRLLSNLSGDGVEEARDLLEGWLAEAAL